MSAPSATAQLSRLLAMVPWLLQRQGVPLGEAARHFGITEDQLVKDLQLLFVCGTPGHLPDDLIDASWESGHVFLHNADPISRPLRLGVDEAVALLAGLRTLADVPGLHDREVIASVLDKLSTAAGEAAARADTLHVDLSRGVQEHVLSALRDGVRRRRRLRLRYLVPSRDETTQRDVDPLRVLTASSLWYLEGWCHRAESVRLFRVDRILEATVLEDVLLEDGDAASSRPTTRPGPRSARPERDETDLFTPSPDDLLVTVELRPDARWVIEYYPVEEVEDLPDGCARVTLRTASPDWVPRLALRLGGSMTVLDPPSTAARVAALAADALALYTTDPPSHAPRRQPETRPPT